MADGTCALARVDAADLAWAAGFFDGEGSTVARTDSRRPDYKQLVVCVAQRGRGAIPDVLPRFESAVLGMGRIGAHSTPGVYMWRSCGFEEAQAVIGLLWRWLGPVKKAQALRALRTVRQQYERGACVPRRSRRPSRSHWPHLAGGSAAGSADLEAAWAAGFLDAEGCFGVARSHARKRGPAWYRLRASASQHDGRRIPAEVLHRLRGVLGVGRIERHGEADDFKWLAEGRHDVERVLAVTGRWLGGVKREQARQALETFNGQLRLKGDALHCLRGHTYDHERTRDGRPRRMCNACARLRARRLRAARGIAPRPFKATSRRYNF